MSNKNFFNNNNSSFSKLYRTIRKSLPHKKYLVGLVIFSVFLLCYLIVRITTARNGHQGEKLGLGLDATFKTRPFAYRSTEPLSENDVTLITQTSVERLERLAMMADKWRGPISASIYIRNETEEQRVFGLIRSSLAVSLYVDFHFLYSNHTRYPINNLRNLAIRNAKTDWVFLIDVDFITPLHARDYLKSIAENHSQKKSDGDNLVAYVIPSFSSDLHRYLMPDTKSDLVQFIANKTIVPSNSGICKRCHGPTNYEKWTKTQSKDPVYDANYSWIYEPFLLYKKSEIEDYDERLKGYGWDKNTHTFGMACRGYKFKVLPDIWIVHMNHPFKPWEGTDTYSEQMLDSLGIVCHNILPETKKKYGLNPDKQIFNEPLNDNNCVSKKQWSND